MKKIFISSMLILISISLIGCLSFKREEGALDFFNLSEKFSVPDGYLNIYYPLNEDIPYVNPQEFIKLMGKATTINYIYDVYRKDNMFKVKMLFGDADGETIHQYGPEFDFSANTVLIDCDSFFSYINPSTDSGISEGLMMIDAIQSNPSPVIINFDEYNIKIIKSENKYLVPFHIANLFFSGDDYDVYFNGDRVYGYDTDQIMDREIRTFISSNLRKSSFNNKEMTSIYKEYNKNFTALAFDYFYGLKEEKIGKGLSFKDSFSNLIDGSDVDVYTNFRQQIINLDDLHSTYIFPGFYEPNTFTLPQLSALDLGPRTIAYYNSLDELENFHYEINKTEMFEVIDNTLFIFFDSFDLDTLKKVKEYFNNSLDQKIDNIVLDISTNGGGVLGVMIQLMGFITSKNIPICYMNTLDKQTTAMYYQTSYPTINLNWYVLTSEVTFSAANLFVSVAKENEFATIIGRKSSGGACAISFLTTPDGSCLVMSSTMKLSNLEFSSIEYGIDVDIEIEDVTLRTQIASMFNN